MFRPRLQFWRSSTTTALMVYSVPGVHRQARHRERHDTDLDLSAAVALNVTRRRAARVVVARALVAVADDFESDREGVVLAGRALGGDEVVAVLDDELGTRDTGGGQKGKQCGLHFDSPHIVVLSLPESELKIRGHGYARVSD
jgi:hypothetical protein